MASPPPAYVIPPDHAVLDEVVGAVRCLALIRGSRPIGPSDHVAADGLATIRDHLAAADLATADLADLARAAGAALAAAGAHLVELDALAEERMAGGPVDPPTSWPYARWLDCQAHGVVAVIRGREVGLAYAGRVRAWLIHHGRAVVLSHDGTPPGSDDPGALPRILVVADHRISLDTLGVAGTSPPTTACFRHEPGDRLIFEGKAGATPELPGPDPDPDVAILDRVLE